MKVCRTYTIRLFPNKEQKEQIERLSFIRNSLYNHMLSEELKAFKKKDILNEYAMNYMLPSLKKEQPMFKELNSKACQRVCKEIYTSFKSFFALHKKGDKKARIPSLIKDCNVFHTIVYNQSGWIFVDHETIKLNGITLQYKGNKEIDFLSLNVKEVRLKKINNKYLLDVCSETEIEDPKQYEVQNKVLAIDLGLEKLAYGIDNLGNVVTLDNKASKTNKYFRKQIGKIQQKLSTKQKGSRRYEKLNNVRRKLYKKKNSQVTQALHTQSKKLACMDYKTIVVGDLTVKQLMSTEGANKKKKNVRRSFHETCISRFMEMLKYKCIARNTEVETISERWTTQTNCLTGRLFKEKVELKDREVWLSDSILLNRDLNAAINILRRYEQNHIALMTTPLDVSNVVARHNLATNL